MRKLIAISFFVFSISIVSGQNLISKTLIDKETNQPVMFAHVYIKNDLQTGTVSNTDGKFVLKDVADNDTVVISHLSYDTFSDKIENIQSDTIYLIPKTEKIQEVKVTALSAYSVMEKVIENLTQNHFAKNTMYQIFTRVIEYEKNYSELHILGEYLINLYESKSGKYKYKIVKIRVKPFSAAGKKAFKDYRLIPAIATYDWAYIFDEDIFQKKKLKSFHISLEGEFTDEQGVYIKLLCKAKKSNEQHKDIVLYIDKSTFGIKKCIIKYSETEYNETGYQHIGDKWYIAYFKRNKKTDFYKETKIKKDSKGMLSWEAVYNFTPNASYNKDDYKSFINIVAEPIRYYNGNWNDDFWENYNYIPLPDWIKQIIEKKSKIKLIPKTD